MESIHAVALGFEAGRLIRSCRTWWLSGATRWTPRGLN